MIFSTVIGGAGNDILTGMVRDVEGNFYLTGVQQHPPTSTNPGPFPDFPVTPDALRSTWNPAFLLKLSADASTLLYGTFLGESNVETAGVAVVQPVEMKIGADGKLRMVAASDQGDIALSPDSFQPCYPTLPTSESATYFRRWTYLQFSTNLRVIEYATAIPAIDLSGPLQLDPVLKRYVGGVINGPFDFDTAGQIYISATATSSPFHHYFEVLNISQGMNSGPTCLADFVTQTVTPAAPGLLVSILGPGMGPDQPTPLALDAAGRVATQLAGTQVLFGDIPAPILSAEPSRIDAVVPFGVPTSGQVTISVLRDGNLVGTITNALARTAPKLFTVDGTGYGAALWNQDGTPNSADNPAHLGDIVTIYGTGAGIMSPIVIDGAIPQSPQAQTTSGTIIASPFPPQPYCKVTYSGDAPGLVEGIFQVNCQVAAAPLSVRFSMSSIVTSNVGPQIYTLYTK